MSPEATVYFCSKTTDSLLGHHHHIDVSVTVTNAVSAFITLERNESISIYYAATKKNVLESIQYGAWVEAILCFSSCHTPFPLF